MIIDQINAYLASPKTIDDAHLVEVGKLAMFSFERQFGLKEESERTLRLSSIGQCLRKQAYNILGYEINGKEIDPRAKMVFFQGDMAEMAIMQLAIVAGCKITHTGLKQLEVEVNGVKGHPDGILETDLENYLVEVKSMSSYSFADFESGKKQKDNEELQNAIKRNPTAVNDLLYIDEGYLYQINAYLYALKLDKCIVIALNKDAGVMYERIITKNQDIQHKILHNILILQTLDKTGIPEPKYVANDKGIYPFQCLYCGWHKTCHPTAEKVLIGKSYKLKELANDTK